MKKLIGWLQRLDEKIVKILLIGFIFLVPLYPKLPLKMVNFTYIAIRLEDIYLSILVLIFLIQVLRKKIRLSTKFISLFIIFWISVFISFLSGVYWLKTIDYPHLGFLHSARRIEYMILFFIAGSITKTKEDFFHLINPLLIALTLVNLYALGQKFLGFPAIQTMNPEFAKGRILYLTPEARISATFAGHYDLAAYLVFLIPIVLSFYFFQRKKRYFFLFLFSLLTLVYTASRISFGSYIISITLLLIFLGRYPMAVFIFLLSIGMMISTKDLSKRFLKTIQIKQILVNQKTGEVYIPQKITTKELPAGSLFIKLKKQDKKLTSEVKKYKEKLLKQKALLEASRSGRALTASEQAQLAATLSADIKPIKTVISDISFATRLQVEWPRAINAFLRNPLFGTGPSSITEATDNDYLRWLGELGLAGTLSFLSLLISIAYFIYLKAKRMKQNLRYILYGLLFGLFGLLINASYIDVFEASKVAYTFWTVNGIFIGYLSRVKTNPKK